MTRWMVGIARNKTDRASWQVPPKKVEPIGYTAIHR